MRVAVVGCGSVGRRHLINLAALGCELVAVDLYPDALARARCAVGTTLSTVRLLSLIPNEPWDVVAAHRQSVDAFVIATPATEHLNWVQACVAAQMPFFVEKPLGVMTELEVWRALVERDRLPIHQVGYNLRFQPQARALHAALAPADGGLLAMCCDARMWPGTAYAGLLEELSHEIDLALWLGAPAEISSAVVTGERAELVLGTRWGITLDWRQTTYRRHWAVHAGRHAATYAFSRPDELGAGMYRDEMAAFLAVVSSGLPYRPVDVCTLPQALTVLEVCQQAETMSREVVARG